MASQVLINVGQNIYIIEIVFEVVFEVIIRIVFGLDTVYVRRLREFM